MNCRYRPGSRYKLRRRVNEQKNDYQDGHDTGSNGRHTKNKSERVRTKVVLLGRSITSHAFPQPAGENQSGTKLMRSGGLVRTTS